MDTLLDLLADAMPPDMEGEEYRQAVRECGDAWRDAGKTVPPELLDELEEITGALNKMECSAYFAQGFRLGVRLLLSALIPGYSDSPDIRHSSSDGR